MNLLQFRLSNTGKYPVTKKKRFFPIPVHGVRGKVTFKGKRRKTQSYFIVQKNIFARCDLRKGDELFLNFDFKQENTGILHCFKIKRFVVVRDSVCDQGEVWIELESAIIYTDKEKHRLSILNRNMRTLERAIKAKSPIFASTAWG